MLSNPQSIQLSSNDTQESVDAVVADFGGVQLAQSSRMRGVVGAAIVSFIWATWVALGANQGQFPWAIATTATLWVTLCAIVFVALIKTNLNLRLRDIGLSMYCVIAATFGVLVAMHFCPTNLRSASYLWAIIAFSVGNLSSTFRSVRLTAALVISMALVEGLIYSIKTGFSFDSIWQLSVFFFAILFIAYAIVVVGKRAAASTRRLEHSAQVLDTISEAVFTLDLSGNVQSLNHAALGLCGANVPNCVGKNLKTLLRPTSDQDRQIIDSIVIAFSKITSNRRRTEANWNQFSIQVERDGQEQSVKFETHIRTVSDSSGRAPRQVVVLRDISHISLLLNRLQHESTHDDLTGLLNRRGLKVELQTVADEARIQKLNVEHALLIIDLDQFKVINDACGHGAGDQLLKEIALVLTNSVRVGDRVARQGGDEFAVLMCTTSATEIDQVAQKILNGVAQLEFKWMRRKFKCGASIGASLIDQRNNDVNQTLLRADSALYLAKELGRGRFQMYCESDTNVIKKSRELAWATRIHQALADNHFELFAQKVQAVGNENGGHYEIFLRLPNEHHGFDSPHDFLPSAERFELTPMIDRWVVSRTIIAINAQPNSAHNIKISVSINLSNQTLFDSEFVPFLEKVLLENKFSANRLYFEITESIALENLETARRFIGAIKQLGCHFALDEVSNVYNTVPSLRDLDCDFVKLNSHLSSDLEGNRVNQDLIISIVNLARFGGTKVVAKMVERPATVATLRSIGIDAMQGYWIHKPEPLRAVLGRNALLAKASESAALHSA
jgi:diguanylate cyclase (GGDEF)-like protein